MKNWYDFVFITRNRIDLNVNLFQKLNACNARGGAVYWRDPSDEFRAYLIGIMPRDNMANVIDLERYRKLYKTYTILTFFLILKCILAENIYNCEYKETLYFHNVVDKHIHKWTKREGKNTVKKMVKCVNKMRKILKKLGKKLPWMLTKMKNRFKNKKQTKNQNLKPQQLLELSQETPAS